MQQLSNIGAVIKDSTNPFIRQVYNATAEETGSGMFVPYYLCEEIKESVFQSDHACDSIHKALMARLDARNATIQHRTLHLIKYLMLEGPSSFGAKMPSQSGKILGIAQMSDTKKDTVEEACKQLAHAISKALSGDPTALTPSGPSGPSSSAASTGQKASFRSDFQQQQEKEQRLHRKRLAEEKKGQSVITNERLYETFDPTLTPAKLVESVLQSSKKKFAHEELVSFMEATVAQEQRCSEVCIALDNILKDPRVNLTQRYKILSVVDVLINESQHPDIIKYWKSHTNGIQRHTTIDQADNPTKSEQAKAMATKMLSDIASATVPLTAPKKAEQAATPTSASSSSAPAPSPQHHHQPPPSSNRPRASSGAVNFKNDSFGGGGGINSVFADPSANFGGMAVKPRQQQQQQPASGNASFSTSGTANNNGGGWGSWGNSEPAQPPVQHQQPQQQQSFSQRQQHQPSSSAVNPLAPTPQADAAAAQLAQMQAMQLQMQQMMAMAQQQPPPPQAAPPRREPTPPPPQPHQQPAEEVPSRSASVVSSEMVPSQSPAQSEAAAAQLAQMQAMQLQMQQMMAMAQQPPPPQQHQQQPQAPPPPAQEEERQEAAPLPKSPPSWGSSVAAPPPIRDPSEEKEQRSSQQRSTSPAEQQQQTYTQQAPPPISVDAGAAPASGQPSPGCFSGSANPVPPPNTPQAQQQQGPPVTLEMLKQLQDQIEKTQDMLQRQQQMFQQLQQRYVMQQMQQMNAKR